MSAARRPRRAWLVVDLGFGDAGKGTAVDHLARERGARLVVRFNGGAQAGHNVVAPDGRHHTFAQFGAATFVPGVRTHLSKHMVVHPTALLVEARHLRDKGVPDAMARLTISADALCITPFQQAANRLRELARGANRHGTCGVGVGETVADSLADPKGAIRLRDLLDPPALRARLLALRERKRAELAAPLAATASLAEAERERRLFEDDAAIDGWIEALTPFREPGLIVDDAHLAAQLRTEGDVLFEGAQGVLLDEWRGFHPHTTWSTCTFDNALGLLRDHGFDGEVVRLGVVRTYATRHGQGPMPTTAPELEARLPEPHNNAAGWQGVFRMGWPDWVLTRYALAACGGADALAVTHLDRLASVPEWRVCQAYRLPQPGDPRLLQLAPGDPTRATGLQLGTFMDLAHQEALTQALGTAKPEYAPLDLGSPGEHAERYLGQLEQALGVPVWLTSAGPSSTDKQLRGGALAS